jgi:hypothetical protein
VFFAGPLATFPILDYLPHVGQRHSLSVTPAAIATVTHRLWLHPADPLPDHDFNLTDDSS